MTTNEILAASSRDEHAVEAAALTHPGTVRVDNEDSIGVWAESQACVVAAVADGVSSGPGGEVASQMAIETMLESYRVAASSQGAGRRLYHAVQEANIAIYDRAVAVPELRGMATTLTAVAIERGELTAVHVGDSRLYLVRGGRIVQLTKDHTLAASKARMGLARKDGLRDHPDRCVLTRSVGRELIVTRDRITRKLCRDDVLVLCTDGLHNVLSDEEIGRLSAASDDAEGVCHRLIVEANALGSADNLSVAVVRVVGGPAPAEREAAPAGLAARMRRFVWGGG